MAKWFLFLFGLIAGYFIISHILVVLIYHFRYVLYLAKNFPVAKAQRIDGKNDWINGPVPYFKLLFMPVIEFFLLIIILTLVFIYSTNFNYFISGLVFSILLCLISLYDLKGRFKRDAFLIYGENYQSINLKSGTLKDEQILNDLPDKVLKARNYLLSKKGRINSNDEVESRMMILEHFEKPTLLSANTYEDKYRRSLYDFNKVKLSVKISIDKSDIIDYEFDSRYKFKEENKPVNLV